MGVAIFSAVYLFPFLRMLWNIGDEGTSLDGARRVLQGQIPGRDFLEIVAPGAFWWPALFLKAFGVSIVTAHTLVWLTGIAIALLMFHLSRRIGGAAFLCAAFFTVIGIPIWPGNSYHWDSTLFYLLTFVALIEWQKIGRHWLLIASGLSAGATTLILQHEGVLIFGAVLLSIILSKRPQRKRAVVFLAFAYVAVLASAITYYALNGALGDLISTIYGWPHSRYLRANASPYGYMFGSMLKGVLIPHNPSAWILGCFLLLSLAIVFAVPGLLITAALLLRTGAFTRELLPFWICGAAMWVAEIHKPDMLHLIWASPILLILLSRFVYMTRSGRLIAGFMLASSLAFAGVRLMHPLGAHTRIESRKGSFWSTAPDNALAFIQAHTRRGDAVFIYPYYPLYNFLSDTQNPTRFNYFLYGYNTPREFREAVENLESKRVRYVLWDTTLSGNGFSLWFPSYHSPPHDQQIIEPYLESHYRQIGVENGFRILERNEYVSDTGPAPEATRERQFVSSR